MTNAFEKVVKVINRLSVENGGWPKEIDLSLYPSRKVFERLKPGEDYNEHLKLREKIVSWCKQRGIVVIDRDVTHHLKEFPQAPTSEDIARAIVQKPYRLGMIVGAKAGVPGSNTYRSATGLAVVSLDYKIKSGTE